MSWYDKDYVHRVAISVDNTAGGGGTADVSIAIPADLDVFWDNVLSSGFDAVLCGADGKTVLTFQRQTWTYASKIGILEIDNMTVVASSMHVVWLYWGNASASDLAGSFTASGAITGYLNQRSVGINRVTGGPEQAGAAKPRQTIAKITTDVMEVWTDVRSLLSRRWTPYEGHDELEEVSYVTYSVLDTAGSAVASMATAANTRIIDGWVSTEVKAGTTATDYTLSVVVTTDAGHTWDLRTGIKVIDVLLT